MDQESRRVSLKWKIGGTYTAVMLILSVFVIAAMYQLTNNMLRDQLDKRALAVATNLSDATAGHLVGRNLLALHALLRKYSLLDGVAYAFVEDNKGEIIAHTLETFPPEVRQGLPAGGQRETRRRELSWRDKTIYETSVPVLEGQVGTVHVGFWADAVEKEIKSALFRRNNRDRSLRRHTPLVYSSALDCPTHRRINRSGRQGHQGRPGNVGQWKVCTIAGRDRRLGPFSRAHALES